MAEPNFEIIRYPRSRRSTIDLGVFARNQHRMFALLELDVTVARRELRALRRAGEVVSLTAWLIKVISDCVARNPQAQAMRRRGDTVVAFRDVDVALPIERVVDGTSVPLPLVLRAANTKSALDLEAEISGARGHLIRDETGFILGRHAFSRHALRFYLALPQVLRVFVLRRLFGNPFRARANAGTVMVTTVSAADGVAGWIVPTRTMHNLAFALGAISRKPWIVDGQITPRDILHLTVNFNHDVIDGVPARKLLQEIARLVQGGLSSQDPGGGSVSGARGAGGA